ncbi:hypothetical protein [Nesterenkonia sandarakina]|uniref:Secreted protein n=1 Tax=Nesterenkonia sandarakina TaxID=272918 RepID=A0A7Z0EBJ6_9MICC|nr:hypothetical protein [Nesterenkonia sandarakina]NYJ18175.1 hypothetical protein [Nesterenkonia sandarakina]
MRHFASVSAGVLLLSSLVACGDQSSTATPEIDAWLQGQIDTVDSLPESHGMMSARETAGAPYREGEGIRIDYADSHEVRTISFSCFGSGSMHLRLDLEKVGGAQGFDGDSYECDDSPHELDLSSMDLGDVNAVEGQGYGASESGAWSVVVEATPE